MNRILLVDADSKIPNLALMKLSTYYKSLGSDVDLVRLGISYYPSRRKKKYVDAHDYDKVFVSAIFFETPNYVEIVGCENVEFGGTGYSIHLNLPDEVSRSELDYSIYPGNDVSYGFITRGCIRNCYFCVVRDKEGLIHRVGNVDDIVRHDKVRFLDNNILAYKRHSEIFEELIQKNIKCSFNEGLDIRLLTVENSKLLSQLNYYPSEYIFAFDNIDLESIIERKLLLLDWRKPWQIKFFVYCDSELSISDTIYRIEWCRKKEVLPYLMRNSNCWKSVNKDFYADLAAYCNQPNIFKKMSPEEYITKRQPKNKSRQEKFLIHWNK